MISRKFRSGKVLWFNCWGLTLLILIIISLVNVSSAADYPAKPIQLICAYPPGGGADPVARIVASGLSPILGQPVVVVNKAGGGGVMGTTIAKAAPPDGYTIFIGSAPMISHPLAIKGVTYDLVRDFIPVNLAVSVKMVMVVKSDAPWKSFQELVAEAKKNPGKLTYSSAGYGGPSHFTMEMLKTSQGVDITHVPMVGTAAKIAAVLGGHVDMCSAELGVVIKHLEAKTLRGLLLGSNRRHILIPDIPTAVEAGFPDNLLESDWQGFFVPLKTPEAIVKRLEKAFKEALNDKGTIETFEKGGWVVENLGSKEMAEYLAKSQQLYIEAARKMKLVPK